MSAFAWAGILIGLYLFIRSICALEQKTHIIGRLGLFLATLIIWGLGVGVIAAGISVEGLFGGFLLLLGVGLLYAGSGPLRDAFQSNRDYEGD